MNLRIPSQSGGTERAIWDSPGVSRREYLVKPHGHLSVWTCNHRVAPGIGLAFSELPLQTVGLVQWQGGLPSPPSSSVQLKAVEGQAQAYLTIIVLQSLLVSNSTLAPSRDNIKISLRQNISTYPFSLFFFNSAQVTFKTCAYVVVKRSGCGGRIWVL